MAITVSLSGLRSTIGGGNQLLVIGTSPARNFQDLTASLSNTSTAQDVNVSFVVGDPDVLSFSSSSSVSYQSSTRVNVPTGTDTATATATVYAVRQGSSIITTTVTDSNGNVLAVDTTALMVAPDLVLYAPDGGYYVIPAKFWAVTTPLTTTANTASLWQLQPQATSDPAFNAIYSTVTDAVTAGATSAIALTPTEGAIGTSVACYVLNLANFFNNTMS